jgi:hypothetical protein
MAAKFPNTSPYVYCMNNPIGIVDPNGMDTIPFNNKGNFGNPIPDNQNHDTYIRVNNKNLVGIK